MEFFDKVPDIRQGDVIVTSSFSCLFPAGLPIGRIESVDLSKSPAPEAVIVLSAPINSLEWAVIYPQSSPQKPDSSCNAKSPEVSRNASSSY
jgi:rod shape-determining protein MreC